MATAAIQLQRRPSPETPAWALASYLSMLEMPEQGVSVGCTETIVHHQGQQLQSMQCLQQAEAVAAWWGFKSRHAQSKPWPAGAVPEQGTYSNFSNKTRWHSVEQVLHVACVLLSQQGYACGSTGSLC